jgi:phage tail sheath protein FI
MPSYLAPGVYVEEVLGADHPIGMVGTSVAGFVGVAPDAGARANEAVAVNNWAEFLRHFAGGEDVASTPLARGVYGFFQNGGGRCYVVNIGPDGSLAGGGRGRSGLQALEAVDEVAIVAAPGYTGAEAYDALLSHCELLRDRVAILDPVEEFGAAERLTRVATAAGPGKKAADDSADEGGLRARASDYGTMYVPWLVIRDPMLGGLVAQPPSGHVAGVWARSDMLRGVHKAPANETVRGALNLTYQVTRQEQELLNPMGVNCIRYFTAEGIRIWGARTLAAESSEWRYLNVRRLFNMLEESIANGTRWMVFEPNGYSLWRSIRRDISAFLTRVWRDGALLGRTPQEAFFVKCDEETNTDEVINAGQVVALIGLAPVKPAEFVVFRLSQSVGTTRTEIMGG